jgi:predicted ester cyclase
MTEAAEVDTGLRRLRETTVLAQLEAENEHDIAATLATFNSGAARTELPGEVADGFDAVADSYRELFAAFPDMRFDIKPGSLCHHGDRVMVETRVLGTHRGPYRGLPPTGARSTCRWSRSSSSTAPTSSANAPTSAASPCSFSSASDATPNSTAGRIATLLNHPMTVALAALRWRRIHNS